MAFKLKCSFRDKRNKSVERQDEFVHFSFPSALYEIRCRKFKSEFNRLVFGDIGFSTDSEYFGVLDYKKWSRDYEEVTLIFIGK